MSDIRWQMTLVSALLAGSIMTLPAQAQSGFTEELSKAVSDGEVNLDFRYRFEHVDDDNFSRTAKASTLRSRLTLATADLRGLTFLAEFDNVSYIGDDKFNSTRNGKTRYPVVADPKGTEVNQARLQYSWEELSGAYGRQRIVHGDQRFIGGVAWRQNEQTYDGFRARWDNTGTFNLDYAYVYNVNRIFGPDDGAQPADLRGENHFLRLDWTIAENHSLAGFYYGLEIDQARGYAPNLSVNNSSDTLGAVYNGKFGPVAIKAAYATQSDAGDSQLDYDADYYLLEGALDIAGLTATLGYEELGADNGVGFKTPYATLHKFQGWADKFLTTPGDGVEDLYVGLTGKLGPLQLGGYYHDFQAQDSGADFGSELDLVATWPVNKQFSAQFKYAAFSADSDRFSDADKAWLTLQLKI